MVKSNRGFEERGKVRLRFVEFELEGLSSTIEESIKNIVGSMNRQTVATIAPAVKPSNSNLSKSRNGGAQEQMNLIEAESEETERDNDGSANEEPSSTPLRRKNPPRYTEPNFLEDLDLKSGENPFEQHMIEKNPTTDNARYLVIAAWFKNHRDLECITIDHIYTCYRAMGWKVQNDIGQPFRQMKRKNYFSNPSKGQWKITFIGLNKVETGAVGADND